ncbi:hypothetical protein [Streptomyces sp. NPDC048340]|uniref:hypothetical protein n=1 Tax=Streptomyces sp. NPDC048340 TaxID=3365537 RepID=UPI003721ADA2
MITHTDLRADLDMVGEFLDSWFARTKGFINICSELSWAGRCFYYTDDALGYVRQLDRCGAKGVYARVTTLSRSLPKGERGGEADTHEVPGLWFDIDTGTEGHQPTRLPLPATVAEGLALYRSSGLPEPTRVHHTGGGLHLYLQFDRPDALSGLNELQEMRTISATAQAILARYFEQQGKHYGSGVGDLARVLRLPGTVNRKTDNARMCRTVENDNSAWGAETIRSAVHDLGRDLIPAIAERNRPRSSAWGDHGWEQTERLMHQDDVLTVLSEVCPFAAVLEPLGWTLVHVDQDGVEFWKRPGYSSSEYSAKAYVKQAPVLVVWSEEAGLPTGPGQKLTVGRLLAQLWCEGDLKAVVKCLVAAARHDYFAPEWARELPDEVLDELARRSVHTNRTTETAEEGQR